MDVSTLGSENHLKASSLPAQAGVSQVKLFLALSRTPHGLLEMFTPAFSALLWLGTFPPAEVMALGLITAFSGYTAVYALNDLVDWRVDQERIKTRSLAALRKDLDNVYLRHPLARGMLSLRSGVFWVVAWAALAMAGAYLLNPVCASIFLLACLLEGL